MSCLKKKIIGGEFCINNEAFQDDKKNELSVIYSLGRTCLYTILNSQKKGFDEILLPDYICQSVGKVLYRLQIPVKHYHVNKDFSPNVDSIRNCLQKHKAKQGIVLVTYFGLVSLEETIKYIRSEYPDVVLIVDDVQNFYGFGKHWDYDYCFTSFRKWFQVPDGACVLQKENSPLEVYNSQSVYSMYKAAGNLLKNYSGILGDEISLELIRKGEEMMNEEYRYCCSELSQDIIQRIDMRKAQEVRKKNAKYLHERLEEIGIFHLFDSKLTPLFIPIILIERDKIREALFRDNIFTPVHWPIENAELQGNNALYNMELSLICDQRYDEEDMERIIRAIEKAL